MEQSAPWYRVLLRALPQRVEWHIRRDKDRLLVTSDFRMFLWYILVLCLVLLFSLLSVGCFPWLEQWLEPGPSWLRTIAATTLFLGLLALFSGAWMLEALGGRATTAVRQEIITELERTGGSFEHLGVELGRRHGISMLSLGGYGCGVIGIFALANQQTSPTPLGSQGAALMLLGLALVLFLLMSAIAHLKVKGFAYRATAILSGLASMISMIFLLALPLLWSIAGLEDVGSFRSQVRADQITVSMPGQDSDRKDEPARLRLAQLRYHAWLGMGPSLIIVCLGLGILAYGASTLVFTWPDLQRLRSRKQAHRHVVGGRQLIRLFQISFLAA
jgi:hypothetical protein